MHATDESTGLGKRALQHVPCKLLQGAEALYMYMQIEAGIKDVSPGQATLEFLTKTMRQTRFWGALLTASLAFLPHHTLLNTLLCLAHQALQCDHVSALKHWHFSTWPQLQGMRLSVAHQCFL